MSSDSKIKFTTSASSKAAGATVTSDTVTMPDHSENHILSVKADSSCSGEVDVQLEMSPDGTNWCPAVTRTVSVTAGAATGARTGNEEYVKLTPDTGEYKNKHCRGGLNFDTNGAVVTPDGSGTRDLLHQHIDINKSFNYSQWFKTSENPTTTYKPVLFRHGGYDNFSNSKVVELTHGVATGTVAINTRVAKGTSNSGNSINNKDFVLSGTNISDLPGFLPDIGNYQSDYKRMPSLMEAWSFSWWVKLGETGDDLTYSNTQYYTGLWAMGRHASGFLKSYAYNGHIYAGIKQPNTDITLMCTGARTAGQWYHCVLTKSAGTGSPGFGNQTDQGVLKFYIDGTLQGSTNLGTSLSDNNFYSMQITETNLLGANPHANNNYYRALGTAEIDEFSAYKAELHVDEVLALRNAAGKPVDPTTIAVSGNKNIPSKICSYYKFGDASNDNTSTHTSYNQIDNAYRTANSRSTISTADPGTQTLVTYNSRGTLHALDTTESIYSSSSTASQLKTTQNLAQQIAFGNSKTTPGTVQDLSYQARIGDPYQNWTICHWMTPYKADNTTQRGLPHTAYYTGTQRFRLDASVFIGGNSNSRIQASFGWYGLGVSSGSAPGYFSVTYMYPYGTSSTINNALSLKHESFFMAATNEHDPSTGVTTNKWQIFNSIGTKIIDYNYSFTPTSAMATVSNYFGKTDETICYDRALTNPEIEAHFKAHPTLKATSPTSANSPITYTNTPVITPVDPTTLSTYSDALIYLRGGDAAGDSANALENVVGANTHFPASMPKSSSTTSLIFEDIGSTKGAFLQSNNSQNKFSINNDLSISGWFKTTSHGVLFSNTSTGIDGLRCDLSPTTISIKTGNQTNSFAHSGTLNDGNWHHVVFTKPTTGSPVCRIYIDGTEHASSPFTLSNINDGMLRGTNGFTLLSDGQENTNNINPAAIDGSKLQASVSNWSLHTEILDAFAVKQLYSNGNVRNIKNLPSITNSEIECWWQLNDTSNGGVDVINGKDLIITDAANTATLNAKAIKASNLTSSAGSGTQDFILNGNKNPWGNNNNMPDLNSAFSMSFWLNIPSAGSTWDVMFGFSATDTRNHFKLHNISNNLSFSFCAGGVGSDYSIDYSNKFNAWHHIVMVKPQGTVQGIEVFVDGVRVAVTQTYPSNGADPSTSGWNNQYVSEFYLFGNGRRFDVDQTYGSNRTGRVFKLDELAFFTGALTHNTSSTGDIATGQVNELWNSGDYSDSSSISTVSGVTLQKYFKFGDHSSDVTSGYGSLKYYDSVNNTAYFQEQDNTNGGTYDLLTTDSHYALAPSTVQNRQVNATGPTYVNGAINGNALTMSLTKSFNYTTKKWVSTADQDLSLCVSFNGFEEQAEYFAIWKCSQTIAGSTINICDGGWHNVILSYRGMNTTGSNNIGGDQVDPGDIVKFGPGPAGNLPYNWALSFDGQPLTSINAGSGVDYVGGLNTINTDSYNAVTYNVGFPVYSRHLRYQTGNPEEEYKPHAQFSAGIHEVTGVDNNNAFQGSVDETSFHSDNWWVDQAATSINTSTYNAEKPATIYGNTTALANRGGTSTDYPEGKPYDLLNPGKLTSGGQLTDIQGTNQYISPIRYDAATNTFGGLEGWWRWGDTPGDCSVTINDVKDHADSINARDITAFGIVTADRVDMSAAGASESIYITDRAAVQGAGSASITFPQVIVENIQAGVCNLRQMASPVLKYLRVKFTGAGSCNLGENSAQAQINFEIKD